jgi:DNA primase
MAFELSDYLETRLTNYKGSAGSEITAQCPSCDKFGGFYANTTTGAYVCFKCDFKGKNAIGLVAELEGITWHEARAYIFRNSVELRRKHDIFTLLDKVRALRPDAVSDAPKLKVEPVAFDIPRTANPLTPELYKWLRKPPPKGRGIKRATADALGFQYCRVGFFAGRLIMPIRCPGGYSFTARDIDGDQMPKYLNPKGADHRRLLMGWDVIPLTGDIALVEGPFDQAKFFQHKIPALGCGGKVVHDEQFAMLRRLPSDTNITIMFDPEEETAPFNAAEKLSTYFSSVYIGKLPEGVDPGDSDEKQANEAMEWAKKWTGSRQDKLNAKIRQLRRKLNS